MFPDPRPELRELAPAQHGGDAPSGVLDFSTGVSPLPPPDRILHAFREADLSRYPHPTALPLRRAIAGSHGVGPEEVVAGSGSTELIWALARAFGGPGRRVSVLAPAFGEYAQAARASGAQVEELVCLMPPWRSGQILDGLRRSAPALVFLCRPSNPCLSAFAADEVQALATELPGALIVVDEAYLPMFEGVSPMPAGRNLAVLRSLTKAFALPGLRIGYLLANPEIARAIQSALPPWNVSTPAQRVGEAAMVVPSALDEVRRQIAYLRARLQERLESAGARVEAAGGPFLLCRVPGAAGFARALLARGVRVRDCTSFGLPQHLRVGVRPVAEQALLAEAWARAREEIG